MKITKSKLKQIIMEEITKVLNENEQSELPLEDPGPLDKGESNYGSSWDVNRHGHKNYSLSIQKEGAPMAAILYLNFPRLKKMGENTPGGVNASKMRDIIISVLDNFIQAPEEYRDDLWTKEKQEKLVAIDDKGGAGYRDPSRSRYKVRINSWSDAEELKKNLDSVMEVLYKKVSENIEKPLRYRCGEYADKHGYNHLAHCGTARGA